MRFGLVAVVFGLVLAGCQTSPRGQGEQFMSDAEIEAKDDGTCRSLGAPPGTPIYIDCRLRLRSNRSAEHQSADMGAAMYLMRRY